MNNANHLLKEKFDISEKIIKYSEEAEGQILVKFKEIDEIEAANQYKVLKAFQNNKVSDTTFNWKTGYGYDDLGREAVEKIYAEVFNTEDALVRTQIVNGTHALAISLLGILRPGDQMLSCAGAPYDTLQKVIGKSGSLDEGTLEDYNIGYNEIPLSEKGEIQIDKILNAITNNTKLVYLQRTMGYSFRKGLSVSQIGSWAKKIKEKFPNIITMVDNCYGEFAEELEPTDYGVDLMAGSLIKNPGGGLCLSGGYIVGKKDLIDKISYRLSCPGIGGECGLTFGQTRNILQGLFNAPKVVGGALKGAIFCGQLFNNLGFQVCPSASDKRSDIIQAVRLNSKDALESFCLGIQESSPVDSFVTPEPSDMPGYENKVIMAAGTFVQGSSIELSADGPLKEPYNVFFQGGLSYEYSKLGAIKAADNLYKKGLLNI